MKRPQHGEQSVFVVRAHSDVCPKAQWSHIDELFYDPEGEPHISNIYGQFIIDVPI